jgi:CDP-glycerol glycerophosphotransferase
MPQISRIPGLRQLPQLFGPVREDVVLFESWRGQFSDNPRAISEELHRRGVGLEHVWVIDPALAGELPDWVVPVAPESAEHIALMGRARYLVANGTVLGFHRKRRGTTFMQTWHGTPLKRIGFHTRRSDSRTARLAAKTLAKNIPNWDLLVSPNAFSTAILREAFRYSGTVLETGYPRTDLLVAPEAGAIRERVRKHLGIAPDQCAVLYAPTFRDDRRFALEADVQQVARELGGTHVVLLRTHKIDTGQLTLGDESLFQDVSRYSDNRELYLAADLLVTDYSSVMFDFAVTRKPMLFYAPDLAEYRDELRGFYFDFEAEAPGPILSNADALTRAVEDVEAGAERWKDAYAAFVDRFCHLDDGRASARVVDALLATG